MRLNWTSELRALPPHGRNLQRTSHEHTALLFALSNVWKEFEQGNTHCSSTRESHGRS
jgi:hypothetical protein